MPFPGNDDALLDGFVAKYTAKHKRAAKNTFRKLSSCHWRGWEALFLGEVPIIARITLSANVDDNLGSCSVECAM